MEYTKKKNWIIAIAVAIVYLTMVIVKKCVVNSKLN